MADYLLLKAKEKSTYGIDVVTKDENGVPIPPNTFNWTLMTGRGTVVNAREGVVISSPTGQETIVLSGDDLAIYDEDNDPENAVRVFSVYGTYDSTLGADLPYTDEVYFYLTNLLAITGTSTQETAEHTVIGNTQTTTSGIATFCSLTLDDESTYTVEGKIIARETDGTNRAIYHLDGFFYREGGGATQEGNTTSICTTESDIDWDCSFDTDGNDVRIAVNSNTVASINWYATLEYIKLS